MHCVQLYTRENASLKSEDSRGVQKSKTL